MRRRRTSGATAPERLGDERPVADHAVAHRVAHQRTRPPRPGACRARAAKVSESAYSAARSSPLRTSSTPSARRARLTTSAMASQSRRRRVPEREARDRRGIGNLHGGARCGWRGVERRHGRSSCPARACGRWCWSRPRGSRTTRTGPGPGCGCPCPRRGTRRWRPRRGGAPGSARWRARRGRDGGGRGAVRDGVEQPPAESRPETSRGCCTRRTPADRRARPRPRGRGGSGDRRASPRCAGRPASCSPQCSANPSTIIWWTAGSSAASGARRWYPSASTTAGMSCMSRTQHLGVPADRDVAQRLEGRRELDVALERVAGEMRGPIARVLARELLRADLAPAHQRLGDAEAPGGGIDDRDHVEDAVAVGEVVPLDPGVAQGGAVPLREDAVGGRVGVDEVGVAVAHRLDVDRLEHADPAPQGRVGGGHAGDVLDALPAPEAEARARRGERQRGVDRRHVRSSAPGMGLRYETLVEATTKPQDS